MFSDTVRPGGRVYTKKRRAQRPDLTSFARAARVCLDLFAFRNW